MAYVWWALVILATVIYPAVLLRCALRGHRWARDTLEAMRYVGGDLMTSSAWLALPPHRHGCDDDRDRVLEA
tara:strand:- start:1265 stop:1480 length:216 start_codon:yes stop_codon:yes gene_type:complete